MPLTATHDRLVAERMREYVDRAASWTRRSWSVSAITEFRELLECAEAVAVQTLSASALRYLKAELIRRVMADPGFGPPQGRAALKALLPKDDLVARSHDWHVLAAAADTARNTYLTNWASALAAGQTTSIERCASSIATFLLDEGISETWLHHWLTYHLEHNPTPVTLADLVDHASHKLQQGRTDTDVLVTFAASPTIPTPPPAGWLTAREVKAWRASHGCHTPGLRQYGGLVITVPAFDAHAAVQGAADRVARIAARFALGSKRRFELNESAWLAGERTPFPLTTHRRRVEVHSLERSDQLFELALADPAVDAALELLEPALTGQTTSAIAGAWAAVESLLTGPGDRANVAAGDRLALIAACSFVRHELTTTAWEHQRNATDALSTAVAACTDNRSRARLMEDHITTGNTPTWRHPTDQLAYMRLERILPPAPQGLGDLETHLRHAMRRLYRQRNLILHGGKTDAVAVDATVRTVMPIVAAGMDRVVASSVEQQMSALELAARTKHAVQRYHAGQPGSVVDLLG